MSLLYSAYKRSIRDISTPITMSWPALIHGNDCERNGEGETRGIDRSVRLWFNCEEMNRARDGRAREEGIYRYSDLGRYEKRDLHSFKHSPAVATEKIINMKL